MNPVTIDGRSIALDAPRAQGMTDAHAQAVSEWAESYRETVMHCHFDVVGRDVTAYAANVPGETVFFNFGDGSGDIAQPVDPDTGASVTHTYPSDGVFVLSVRTETDRWSTEVAANWPPPQEAL